MSPPKSQYPLPRKNATADEVVKVLDVKDIVDKHFLITGANSGIGFETCRTLAINGGHVTMACRNVPAAAKARETILRERPDAHITVMQLDLADLTSVEKFAEEFNESAAPIHCLINNAGVYAPQKRITNDNFETTFQTNHLGHYYLVQLLEDVLIKSAPSRVVVVSSKMSQHPSVRNWQPKDITWTHLSPTPERSDKMHSVMRAYCVSKLCNILHAKDIAQRLESRGVVACSVHPGLIATNIQRNDASTRQLIKCCPCISRDVEVGAATVVYCALVPDLADFGNGQYFDRCRIASHTLASMRDENVQALRALSDDMLSEWRSRRVTCNE